MEGPPRRFSTCDGPPLPRQLEADGFVAVHLEGCAVWPSSQQDGVVHAELVLTAELSRKGGPTVFYQQSAAAAALLQVRLEGGWRCRPPVVGLHALLVRCAAWSAAVSELAVLRVGAGGRSTEVALRERHALAGGGLMMCTGRVVYGAMAERLRMHAGSLAAWEAVGCRRVWSFAQSESDCAALRRLGDSLACEVRGTINAAGDRRSEHLYEQPVRHLLCLVYARAAHAAFLALADADEEPPPLLPRLLEQAAAATKSPAAGRSPALLRPGRRMPFALLPSG